MTPCGTSIVRSVANRPSDPRIRRIRTVAGPVDSDDRVEVHDPAALELGDLGVADPELSAERGLADAEAGGQPSPQGDHEAPPQLRGPPVERDRGQVVVAVGADRFAEFGVVVLVGSVAGPSPAMGADLTSASGPASAGASANPPAPAPGAMHGTEPGTGE